MSLELTCPDCPDGHMIPKEYTCEGNDVHPPLEIKGAPPETKSFAITLHDPDAPNGNWVHWLVWNILAGTTALEKGFIPQGVVVGLNSWGANEYGGPCPPDGTHRYIFTLYALNDLLGLEEYADIVDLKKAMETHILEQAELVGHYQKQRGFE